MSDQGGDDRVYIAPETISLRQAAKELGTTIEALKKQEKRGDFPRLLRVSAQNYRVLVRDYLAFLEGRWSSSSKKLNRVSPEERREMQKRNQAG